MAAGRGAAVELEVLVVRRHLVRTGMTVVADVLRLRYAHGKRRARLVLGMAGDACLRIDLSQPLGIARIVELAGRMRISGFLQLILMAFDACLLDGLLAGERLAVAALARQFDLVVAVAGLTRQECHARGYQERMPRRLLVEQPNREICQHRHAQHTPVDPQNSAAFACHRW
ncbi:hypothetical protein D3C72_1520690 [compost metagenome]